MAQESISGSIRRWRKKRGMSLADLAVRVGTSPATLSKYESGWRRFELYTLEKISTALGCRLVVSFEPLHRGPGSTHASTSMEKLSRLFWDRKLRKGDLRKHPKWVAERVLEYGSLEDVHSLISLMGKKRFLKVVSQCRFQSKKTRNFWEQILSQENMPCMKRSYPREPWLS